MNTKNRKFKKVIVNSGNNGILVKKMSGESFKKVCQLSKNTEFYKELESFLEEGRKKLSKFDKQFNF